MITPVWVRIDDRLIHGQVVTAWVGQVRPTKILIVDAMMAADSFMKPFLESLKPGGVPVAVVDVEQALRYLEGADDQGRCFVLVREPTPLRVLQQAGVRLQQVNVGGMGMRTGRVLVWRNIASSPEEWQSLQDLQEHGAEVFLQPTPADPKVKLHDVKFPSKPPKPPTTGNKEGRGR